MHPFTGREKKSLKNYIETINLHRQADYTKKQEIPVEYPLLKLFSKSFVASNFIQVSVSSYSGTISLL